MRRSEINRKTAETDIRLALDLDNATDAAIIDTGVGFLDHMLTLFARHSGFALSVKCDGDTRVDDHHSVEDIGIALGQAMREALGDKRGIVRYASVALPMDEALILCAVDISGRGGAYLSVDFPTQKIGSFDTELVAEFLNAFAVNAGVTVHVKKLDGKNSHHIAEGCFKALARALRAAVQTDESRPDEIPSTKGTL